MNLLLKMTPRGLALLLIFSIFVVSLFLTFISSYWWIILVIIMLAAMVIFISIEATENDIETIESFFYNEE